MNLIAAILPLKISGDYQDHDLYRAKILLNSLHCNWKGLEPLSVSIVSPKCSLDQVSTEFIGRSQNLNVNVFNELDLLPQFADAPINQHWYKQQIIKLASYNILDSKYSLTLDADIVLYKPLYPEDIYIDDRILTGWENMSHHPDWWSVSAERLGLNKAVCAGPLGMHPTPQFLSTRMLADLHGYLNSYYSCDAWTFLLNNRGWTEYTLYNLYLNMTGNINRFHHTMSWAIDNKISIKSWRGFSTLAQFNAWNPECAFKSDEPGYFGVLNSSSKITPEQIWKRIMKYFPETPFVLF